MKNGWLQMVAILAAVAFIGQEALAADGHAQLGHDERQRGQASDNWGFAFMQNVQVTTPGNPGFTDTCTTLDKFGQHTLIVTDGVASPENPEPILRFPGEAADTAVFYGRTGRCYYIVTGTYSGGEAGGGGGETAKWYADFDTETSSPHFVLYINDRYCSGDDVFTYGVISTLSIEVANPANGNTVYFRLNQQSSNDGKVDIMQDDGITPEPLREDGSTERVYMITPDPQAMGPAFPNGSPVQVQVMGLDPGDVSIIATEATP